MRGITPGVGNEWMREPKGYAEMDVSGGKVRIRAELDLEEWAGMELRDVVVALRDLNEEGWTHFHYAYDAYDHTEPEVEVWRFADDNEVAALERAEAEARAKQAAEAEARASWEAWKALPEEGERVDAGPGAKARDPRLDHYEVNRAAMTHVSARVLVYLVDAEGTEYGLRPLWAHRWREALEAFEATGKFPREACAPVMTWGPDEDDEG